MKIIFPVFFVIYAATMTSSLDKESLLGGGERQYMFPLHYSLSGKQDYGLALPAPHAEPVHASYGYPAEQSHYGTHTTAKPEMKPEEEKEKRLFCVVGQVFVTLVLLDIEAGLLLTYLIWPGHYGALMPPLAQPIAAIFHGITDMLPFPNVAVINGRSLNDNNSTSFDQEVCDDNEVNCNNNWGRVGEVFDLMVSLTDGEECGHRVACEYGRNNPEKATIWRLLKFILPKTYAPVFEFLNEGVKMKSCQQYQCGAFEKHNFKFLFRSTNK